MAGPTRDGSMNGECVAAHAPRREAGVEDSDRAGTPRGTGRRGSRASRSGAVKKNDGRPVVDVLEGGAPRDGRGDDRPEVAAEHREEEDRERGVDEHLAAGPEVDRRVRERASRDGHPEEAEREEDREVDVGRDHPEPATQLEPRDAKKHHARPTASPRRPRQKPLDGGEVDVLEVGGGGLERWRRGARRRRRGRACGRRRGASR